MGRVSVRKGRRSDATQFLGLLEELARFEKLALPTPAAKKRIVRDIFDRKKIRLLLAVDGEECLGYAIYFQAYSSFLAKPTLYIEDLFVLEKQRGRRVGTALFSRCVKEAIRLGCGRMEWAVLKWNRRAIAFYEKLGARRLREWDVYRLDEESLRRVHSRKRLSIE